MSKHFENTARRTWWSVHVEAWQRSGLSQRRYCRQHRLDTTTFARWLKVLADAESLRLQWHFDADQRRQRRPRRLSTDTRNPAVQAFWISRNRRLARDFERHCRIAAAFVRIAMIRIMLRRLAAKPSA